MTNLEQAKLNFLNKETNLSKYATKSSDAIRIKKINDDIRTPYFRDIDRIIHSLSYTRYIDKTQVYSFKDNDHISKRMIHVQLVSKIARTIGRSLKLNEDLIEAIALGHDIGHTPLGHAGEAMLNEISKQELNEYFAHNIQGVRNLMYVDNNGNGQNLTLQTLDGVFCHNGEMVCEKYEPLKKDLKEFMREYEEGYIDLKNAPQAKSLRSILFGKLVRRVCGFAPRFLFFNYIFAFLSVGDFFDGKSRGFFFNQYIESALGVRRDDGVEVIFKVLVLNFEAFYNACALRRKNRLGNLADTEGKACVFKVRFLISPDNIVSVGV